MKQMRKTKKTNPKTNITNINKKTKEMFGFAKKVSPTFDLQTKIFVLNGVSHHIDAGFTNPTYFETGKQGILSENGVNYYFTIKKKATHIQGFDNQLENGKITFIPKVRSTGRAASDESVSESVSESA